MTPERHREDIGDAIWNVSSCFSLFLFPLVLRDTREKCWYGLRCMDLIYFFHSFSCDLCFMSENWTYQAVSLRQHNWISYGSVWFESWLKCHMVSLCSSRWMLETNHEIVQNSCLSGPFSFTIHSLVWYYITSVADTASLNNLHSNCLRWACRYWIFCFTNEQHFSKFGFVLCL
jgi:hypothetical protein